MREDYLSKKHAHTLRTPRRWYTFWTYDNEDKKLLERVENLVVEKYPNVIDVKEVGCLIRLKVAGNLGNLPTSLLGIPGVGGFVDSYTKLNPRVIPTLSHGLVRITRGALTNYWGALVEVVDSTYLVRLSIFDRMITLSFHESEVEVVNG